METREWTWFDKSAWGAGEWTDEPDKRQWADDATGLPCIILRGPFGAFCGYVGVPPSHPTFGLHYDGVPTGAAEARSAAYRANLKKWGEAGNPPLDDWYKTCDPLPETHVVPDAGERVADIDVHGGLTFAGKCADLSRERWEALRERRAAKEAEAKRFPVGDAARWLNEWGATLENYEVWRDQAMARFVCHVAEPGEPDVWWFGFDCSHAGDVAPGIESDLRSLGAPTGWGDVNRYRTFSYVEREVRRLAEQLDAIK